MGRAQMYWLWCFPEKALVSVRGIGYNDFQAFLEFSGGHGFLF